MAVEVSQVKSTYRNPATVIETKTDGVIKNIEDFAKMFGDTTASLVAIQNEKLKKTLKQNKAMIDDIAIDPEDYLKRIEQSSKFDKKDFYDQANIIFDENTRLTLAIEKGQYSREDYRELMAKRSSQITALNQMIGLASSEEMVKDQWRKEAEGRTKDATAQGGVSLLGSDFINARNIFAKGMPGTVERVFVDGIAHYKFDDGGKDLLSPEYKNRLHNASTFLSGVPERVPQLLSDFNKIMTAQELIGPNGRLTENSKKMGKEAFDLKVGQAMGSIAVTYAQDSQVANSAYLEIFGKQDKLDYSTGRSIEGDGRPEGIILSKNDYENKFVPAMKEYLLRFTPDYQFPEEKEDKETASDKGRRIKESDRKDRLNAFMELFEQRKTNLGIKKNKAGVFTGIVNLVEPGKDEDGKSILQINPEQEKALNDIGFQILNVDSDLGMTTIALQGEKGDTRIDVSKGMSANDFIRELMSAKGAKDVEAREFAEQFDLNEDGIPDNFESGLSTDIYLEASNFK
jgi:hypothetical protein|tara:strand:+ start:792 stop:2336 length:1545 start_codon:yes stop_codon:yes gene_type:complete